MGMGHVQLDTELNLWSGKMAEQNTSSKYEYVPMGDIADLEVGSWIYRDGLPYIVVRLSDTDRPRDQSAAICNGEEVISIHNEEAREFSIMKPPYKPDKFEISEAADAIRDEYAIYRGPMALQFARQLAAAALIAAAKARNK